MRAKGYVAYQQWVLLIAALVSGCAEAPRYRAPTTSPTGFAWVGGHVVAIDGQELDGASRTGNQNDFALTAGSHQIIARLRPSHFEAVQMEFEAGHHYVVDGDSWETFAIHDVTTGKALSLTVGAYTTSNSLPGQK